MKLKNLYFAQLGEAISLANNEIFEYNRISLILFDNIIENLLRSRVTAELHHLLVIGELDKCDYKNIINEFDKFGKITTQAKKLNIITEKEIPIINFCHSSRNNLYHKLFEDERITDFCILFYCNFLGEYFLQFIETGITEYSDKTQHSSEAILKKEKTQNLSELINKLHIYFSKSKSTPQNLLSEILLDIITSIEGFYEYDAKESWDELNKIVKNKYFYDFEIKKGKNKGLNYRGLIPAFRIKWCDIDNNKIIHLKKQIKEISIDNLELSFKKYITIKQKIEPIYIGIMLYYSEHEEI